MVRHGESTWNQENRFCGWFDAGLSEKGKQNQRIPKNPMTGKNVVFIECQMSVIIYLVVSRGKFPSLCPLLRLSLGTRFFDNILGRRRFFSLSLNFEYLLVKLL
jgi:hypothetical protein